MARRGAAGAARAATAGGRGLPLRSSSCRESARLYSSAIRPLAGYSPSLSLSLPFSLTWHMHGRTVDFAVDLVFSSFSSVDVHGYREFLFCIGPDLLGSAGSKSRHLLGYGTMSEALAYRLLFVFVQRDYFNKEPFLRNMLERYQCGIEMIRRDLLTGHWKPYFQRAITLQPCYDGPINGGEVTAHILQDTAVGKKYISGKLCGARRLCDAIVLRYQLQRARGRDLGIPDWYSL